MADKFAVYDIVKHESEIMDFVTVCSTYPEANLLLLNERYISIISIYNKGKKVAIINRIKEDKISDKKYFDNI